ncbi:YcnI family protein [Jatrophihabitans endophyticus]|uniref:YcnI family copper-binding membrane protein n=1 Tax=Jatrophihabitans endophyticus TaxID=1206085 RepID=UPI0019DA015C|nr:YcnI family protein [Jatrophihabitans endophyticus]MBE7189851.1 YcnI family protein [Jatrophihabitans endophyticus]
MKKIRTVALGAAAVFAGGFVLAGAASAHVTISAPGATSGGGDQEITFRVPVEKDANTVGLSVQLPTDTPIASVDVEPVPGWTHTQKTSKLATPIHTDDGDITSAVTQITWKASDGGLKPGEFGAFTIIAGQLPKAKQLVFRALQTYSDGSVVRWIQTPAPGSKDEPDFPAPTLDLASTSSQAGPVGTDSVGETSASSSSGSSDTVPVVLSIIALVLAAGALGLAVVSRRSRA